ncbi:MAG: DUF2974 domain-containing protein [Atopobiaceae bacterium]|jgi:hypothetical protein|nr:DUF2974 domain-containing protein [Atopobiaceae bacterium]MCH4181408.1 DUF2974 domain-containing protein [Atopobiaceae bacterium]MCH4214830.1 DUF2974 domain-containing protein [Atopobiaceae bacterium]MCH4230219.1 DUF2974 domain-containing protein [Atopobiaceae bacterium]MCH4276952.1 DUF2974 domain-containing protein [Atopobiaceae bacterium]
MAHLLDYLDWYGDLDFDAVPFNEVDNLILSQVSYLDLSAVVPAGEPIDLSHAARAFADHTASEDLGPLLSPDLMDLLQRMASTGRRFSGATLSAYESVLDVATHEQFGAVVVGLADGSSYVSFRGTDASLVGWLEDCEMSYKVVPSQVHALDYLERVGAATSGPLHVGGHSKGGNLAAYATSRCSQAIRDRVVAVWCNDSPGFDEQVVPLASLEPIASRIHLFTPGYSVVGALFEHLADPVVVRSDGVGIMEHSAMDWRVMRGDLVRGERPGDGTVYVNKAFDQLLCSRDLTGRKKLLDDLYQALAVQGITSLDDMLSNGGAGLASTLASLQSLDDDDRKVMQDFLWGIAGGAMADAVAPAAKQLGDAVSGAIADARAGAQQLVADLKARSEETRDDDQPGLPAADEES